MFAKRPDLSSRELSLLKEWVGNHLIYDPNGVGELRKDLYDEYVEFARRKNETLKPINPKIFVQALIFVSKQGFNWHLIKNVGRYVHILNVKLKRDSRN